MARSTNTDQRGPAAGKAARIAVVGAYGSGKTLLSRSLARLTGMPPARLRPMDRPVGAPQRTIADCTPAQLLQLTVRRYTERVAEEQRLADGFVSDGFAAHEWIYAKTRLVAGSFPDRPDPLAGRRREPAVAAYEEVADQLGLLMLEHSAHAYDLFVHVPVEFPLAAGNRPVNENFRLITEELLAGVLGRLGVPVHTAAGPPARRLEQLAAALGLSPVIGIEQALAEP